MNMFVVIAICIFAANTSIISAQFPPNNDLRRSYTYNDTTVRFQHALEDPSSGHIYFLDQRNTIYWYNSELELIQTSVASPSSTSAEQQAFAFDPKTEYLFLCVMGSCWVIKDQQDKFESFPFVQPSFVNVTRPGSRTLLLLYDKVNKRDVNWYYIATAVSRNKNDPFLSIIELSPITDVKNKYSVNFTDATNVINSSLFIHKSFRSTHFVEPIFLHILATFNNVTQRRYGYLITRQPDPEQLGVNRTRIGRFCSGVPILNSYIELSIQCKGRNGNLYTIATDAQLIETSTEAFLAVRFVSSGSSDNDDTAVCAYTLSEVDRLFNGVITNCYNKSLGHSLAYILGHENNCNGLPVNPEY
jgi:hypothetical protein